MEQKRKQKNHIILWSHMPESTPEHPVVRAIPESEWTEEQRQMVERWREKMKDRDCGGEQASKTS